jgi:CheY-like chemotaxis protein
MDIELPEIKGIEATNRIRDFEAEYKWIHTNIIAVTVNVSEMSGI